MQLWLTLTLAVYATLASYPKHDRTASARPPYRLLRLPQEKCLGNVLAVKLVRTFVLTVCMQGTAEPQQDVSFFLNLQGPLRMDGMHES